MPLEFRRKQTVDLIDWKGETSHAGFQALCEGVASAIGSAPQRPTPDQKRKVRLRPRWVLAAIAALIAIGSVFTSRPIAKHDGTVDSAERSFRAGHITREPEAALSVAALADLVVGSYSGDVIADSKGGSRSDIGVTITKLDSSTVRVRLRL